MGICATVAIDNGHGGTVLINESDYNAKKHKLAAPKAPPKAPTQDSDAEPKAEPKKAS